MRYLLLLIVIAIIFVSLCAEIPYISDIFPTEQLLGSLEVKTDSEIYIKVDAIPKEVKSGRDVKILIELRNKANYNLENVRLRAYDTCLFNTNGDDEKIIDELRPNVTDLTSWNWTAGNVTLPTDCVIKFRVSYEGDFSLFQDVAVLTDSEYTFREQAGTLHTIPIQTSSSSRPLKISVSFSEEQPLLDGIGVDMHINYEYTGDAFMDIEDGNVTINVPDNLEISDTGDDYDGGTGACEGEATPCVGLSEALCEIQKGCRRIAAGCIGMPTPCSDFYDNNPCNAQMGCSWTGTATPLGSLYLNKTLKFINKRASPSICTFTTKASQPMDIRTLSLTATYKYILDNSLIIKVKP